MGRQFWDRYSYAHVTALIDKCDGQIQRLIDERAGFPTEQRVAVDQWASGRHISTASTAR